jgi:hypothetical protein
MLLLSLTTAPALLVSPHRPCRAASRMAGHAQMQFGDLFKGLEEAKKGLEKGLESVEEAKKGLEKGLESVTGSKDFTDDGETEQEAEARAQRKQSLKQKASEEEDDIPTKLFKFFIGDPEEGEVQGIARTGSAPDTYPATKTEFAEPVPGDSPEIAHLRPLLKNTNLEFLSLRKAYDANADGWSPEAFHSKVDLTGPCLIVCETEGGAVCGGYAPKGYAGYGEYRGSIAAFLFTWPDGDISQPVIKLQKVGGAGLATVDEPETGPRFGMDGLVIRMDPGFEKLAVSKLGPYYEPMMGVGTKRGSSIFADSECGTRPSYATLTKLEVYVGVWPEGERIPFAGAIPFAIE